MNFLLAATITISVLLALSLWYAYRKGADAQRRNAAVLESITDSFFALDRNGRFTFMTPRAGEVLGKPWLEIRGKTFTEAFPALRDSPLYSQISKSLQDDTASRFEHFQPSLNRWFEHQIYVHAAGGIAVYGRDVTDRRRLEDAVRVSDVLDLADRKRAEKRLRNLVETAKILSSLDIDKMFHELARFVANNIGDSCIIYLREEANLRSAATASRGQNGADLADLSQTPQMRTVLTKGTSEVLEGVGSIVPLPSRGRIAGALFTGFGTTAFNQDDLRLLEDIGRHAGISLENARLYQQTQIASRLKDEFVAALSHELRTPLTPILGAVYMLRSGQSDQRIFNKAIDLIERNAKTQARIIEDLLDVSRIISGKLQLRQEPVELDAAIRAAAAAVQMACDEKKIEVELSLNPLSTLASGDPARLQQVFWKLLSNAVKFTPKGGRIKVELDQKQDHAEIRVTDNGIGIAEQFLPYVFDRLRQEDAPRKRANGGLGVGLAIVRHLVESHGGTVHAHSAGDQQGSTFLVKIPLQTAQDAISRTATAETAG